MFFIRVNFWPSVGVGSYLDKCYVNTLARADNGWFSFYNVKKQNKKINKNNCACFIAEAQSWKKAPCSLNLITKVKTVTKKIELFLCDPVQEQVLHWLACYSPWRHTGAWITQFCLCFAVLSCCLWKPLSHAHGTGAPSTRATCAAGGVSPPTWRRRVAIWGWRGEGRGG